MIEKRIKFHVLSRVAISYVLMYALRSIIYVSILIYLINCVRCVSFFKHRSMIILRTFFFLLFYFFFSFSFSFFHVIFVWKRVFGCDVISSRIWILDTFRLMTLWKEQDPLTTINTYMYIYTRMCMIFKCLRSFLRVFTNFSLHVHYFCSRGKNGKPTTKTTTTK